MENDTRTLEQAGVTVISQQQQTVPDGNGSYAPAIVVRFRTAKGAVASVSVPTAVYSADTARAAVLGMADELDAL